jgi:cysteine dioxygenase
MQVTDTNTIFETAVENSAKEISLGEAAEIIHNLTEVPALDQIKEWFSSLLLRQRDYDRYRLFASRKYARNLIARSSFAEMLMLCWRSGQRTPIHDHGGSVGVVMVCEGLLTETMFEHVPEGRVRPYNTYRWGPGSITGADVPDVHQLLNLQPAGRDLVTLHCYAPPLSVLNTYSPRSSRVGRWREGYFTGGAGI